MADQNVQDVKLDELYDVAVIGGGPAGLTAALYLARAQYRVVVLEKEHFGGQIRITEEVVNYPGVFTAHGSELTETMRRQAEAFGAEFMLAEVKRLNLGGTVKILETSRGPVRAFGVLLATGANPRKIGFKGEAEFQGRGVAYCATCDGEFFTGREVYVIGGGFAAAEEAVFLTKYATKVTVLVRKDKFACAASAAAACLNHPEIEVRFHHELVEVGGQDSVEYAIIKNNQTGAEERITAADGGNFGVFVFAGYIPASNLVKDLVELDSAGYVITGHDQQTSAPGLYAAGDLCIKPLRQVVTAVSDGAIAATELEKYVSGCHAETGLLPQRPKAVVEAAARRRESVLSGQRASAGQNDKGGGSTGSAAAGFLTADIKHQLADVCARFEQKLLLKVYQDDRPIGRELASVMEEVAATSEGLAVELIKPEEGLDSLPVTERPCVRVCAEDGRELGVNFHGVPGGHEFQSFVLGMYNAAGPGQAVDPVVKDRIGRLPACRLQILVSLSCTQCPDLVVAAQRLATLQPKVQVDVYDLNHFEALKDAYKVMSVPCLVFNDGEKVDFGKKNLESLAGLIEQL